MQPFPSNLLTTPDASQATGLRVDLSTAGCTPSDCADLAVLNTLDGFNVQPRISIPFSAPIDVSTVSSSTVFLVGPADHVVGINQIVWEPLTNTLHVESDELLRQDSTYLLVVTNGVHDTNGDALDATSFRHDLNFGQTKDAESKAYRKALLNALNGAMAGGAEPSDIAGASLFTTQSITPISEKIRSQLRSSSQPTADFNLGPAASRTVFSRSSMLGVAWGQQRTTGPALTPFGAPLSAITSAVGTIAFGSYSSPDYETNQEIPAVGTATGTPAPSGTSQIQFTLFVPSGAAPAGGWPTAIFGHGFTDSKNGAPWLVASTLAQAGIASIAINVVGHGYGAAGTYTIFQSTALPVTFPAGGRGIDVDGNGTIDSTEGVSAIGARSLIGNRDGLRQTTIDLMQLVRVLEGGVDVDGVGGPDLSTSRIYYSGQSFGGIYGVQLLGLEPDIRAGVPNVAGGSIIEVARLGAFRGLVGYSLLTRTPSLYNKPPNVPFFTNFDENEPLRNLPPVIDTVPGASAIQALLDNTEWAQNAANPVAYAEHITAPIVFQFARGDKTVPNPTSTAILRAGGFAARATLFRNDLAYAGSTTFPKNPHTFLTNILDPTKPLVTQAALQAQAQIGAFFASDGTNVIDPDGPGPLFETPTSMLPEDLAYIP